MDLSDNSSFDSQFYDCSSTPETFILSTAINLCKAALLLPLYTVIFYLGFQQWRQQRSFSTASHSDIFTFHLAVFEVMWLVAAGFTFWPLFTATASMFDVAYYFIGMSWYGENFFHVLTCVERYLAVVHPIVYMRLRNEQGVRIRNISIVCVWVLSAVCSYTSYLSVGLLIPIPFLVPFALCLVAVSYCSLSVLHVLVQPRPGDGGQDRGWVDKSKQRAFVTVTAILVVLCFWLGGTVVSNVLYTTVLVRNRVKCLIVWLVYLFNLPSASVIPLLYLHRAGKLSFSSHKSG